MNCDLVEAIDHAQEIAGDRDVQIISADLARQALEHDLIDELQVFVAPYPMAGFVSQPTGQEGLHVGRGVR